MLEIRDLRIDVPGFTLGPLSLRIPRGEYFVLLGPSGAGKTTLLEWLAGLRPASQGRLLVDGHDSTGRPPQTRNLGIVFQDAGLFPHMTVRDNLAYPLRLRKVDPASIDRRVRELAELLRLNAHLGVLPGKISGGEARRVALGRALAAGQRTLLLDEPLTGLDPDLRRELRHELALLHRELGLTILHITHHLMEARSLATHAGVLLSGTLAQVASPHDLFRRPANRDVAKFLTVRNFVAGKTDPATGQIEVASGIFLPAPAADARHLHGRVHSLILRVEKTNDSCVRARVRGYEARSENRLSAVVEFRNDQGSVFHLEVDTEAVIAEPGKEIWVDFSTARWDLY